jgi:hypothetical protein
MLVVLRFLRTPVVRILRFVQPSEVLPIDVFTCVLYRKVRTIKGAVWSEQGYVITEGQPQAASRLAIITSDFDWTIYWVSVVWTFPSSYHGNKFIHAFGNGVKLNRDELIRASFELSGRLILRSVPISSCIKSVRCVFGPSDAGIEKLRRHQCFLLFWNHQLRSTEIASLRLVD